MCFKNIYTAITHQGKASGFERKSGLTIIELLIAAMILTFTLGGILFSYLTCLELNELSKNSSLAVQELRSRMEQIKHTPFNQILATYHNVSFLGAGVNGRGISYINNSNPSLLTITLSFCWRQPGGRVIGEDKDLDGILDFGEDANGNGKIDSIVQFETHILNRS